MCKNSFHIFLILKPDHCNGLYGFMKCLQSSGKRFQAVFSSDAGQTSATSSETDSGGGAAQLSLRWEALINVAQYVTHIHALAQILYKYIE